MSRSRATARSRRSGRPERIRRGRPHDPARRRRQLAVDGGLRDADALGLDRGSLRFVHSFTGGDASQLAPDATGSCTAAGRIDRVDRLPDDRRDRRRRLQRGGRVRRLELPARRQRREPGPPHRQRTARRDGRLRRSARSTSTAPGSAARSRTCRARRRSASATAASASATARSCRRQVRDGTGPQRGGCGYASAPQREARPRKTSRKPTNAKTSAGTQPWNDEETLKPPTRRPCLCDHSAEKCAPAAKQPERPEHGPARPLRAVARSRRRPARRREISAQSKSVECHQ